MMNTNNPVFDTEALVVELQEQRDKAQKKKQGSQTETPSSQLWRRLCTIEAFTKMSEHDQLLTWGCLNAYVAEKSIKLSSAKQYGRECVKAAAEMKPVKTTAGKSHVLALLGPKRSLIPAVDLEGDAKNNRISALKALAFGARFQGLIAHADIEDFDVKKIKRVPRPCSDSDLKFAVDRATQRVLNRSATSLAFPKEIRDISMLDIKSYNPRSIEMEFTTRGDFLHHYPSLPIRVSKTETGKRTMVLDRDSVALVFAYIAFVDAYRARRGLVPLGDDDPLWIGVMGRGCSSRSISGLVGDLLPDGIRAHQLRGRIATKLLQTRPESDVGVALGIDQRSVQYYTGAADKYGIMADVASFHAPVDIEVLGIDPTAYMPATHDAPIDINPVAHTAAIHEAPSRSASECWLPDDFDEDLEAALISDARVSSAARAV